ncbi:cytokinin riboside 5'-monophosphate phosphoribohydrolase [Tenuifilaceae bacterium CYCD]|nr:cytokinin riboside 5'-monophosphate phosphoribohydrolase [Tenuifilaceae bacterium CYCD]
MKVCVYCASSNKVDEKYFNDAEILATDLARKGITIVYGGGSNGLMGKIADTALMHKGKVIGILPRFMDKVEWGHKGLTELILVKDMHERKSLLIEGVDAVVALPGGCGTLEELMEVITLKRLGKFTKPIIILNTDGFYEHLKALLNKMVEERFMRTEHVDIWTFVDKPEDIIPAIENAPKWDSDAINFAAV